MLSTTTTALSTSMPTASSRPIIDRMLSVTPAKYMKPSVITKQIGIASVTISVDGQWRRKKNSTAIDSSRPMPPASASSSSELVTFSPWLSMTLIWMPLQRGLLADRLDFRQRRARDLDQVRVALLEDVQADRRTPVEAAAVVHARRLEADVGDVAQAHARGVDHQVAQLLQVGELADRLHAQALAAVVDLRRRTPRSSPPAGAWSRSLRLRLCAVRRSGSIAISTSFGGAPETSTLRHARDAFDAPLELAVDQVVRAGQVGWSLARRTRSTGWSLVDELQHEVALQVVRQFVADRIDALARLGGGDRDVAVPVGEHR